MFKEALIANSGEIACRVSAIARRTAISPALVQISVEGIANIAVSPEWREGARVFLKKRKSSWLGG